MSSSSSAAAKLTYRYVDKNVDANFVCPTCMDVFILAVSCPKCGVSFCKACLDQWLSSQSTCPTCRAAITKGVPARSFNNLVDKLEVYCINEPTCTWTGKRGTLAAHAVECEHGAAECEYCHATLTRGTKLAHESSCDSATQQCQCGQQIRKRDKEEHDTTSCALRSFDSLKQAYEQLRIEYERRSIEHEESIKQLEQANSELEQLRQQCQQSSSSSSSSSSSINSSSSSSNNNNLAADQLFQSHWSSLSSTSSSAITARTFGSQGAANGRFNHPRRVAVDSRGNIVVVDGDNHRIQVFNARGEYIRKLGRGNGALNFIYGVRGAANGQFNFPCAVALDSQGNIFVADSNNHRVQVFNSGGEFIRKFGSLGEASGQMNGPSGIAVDQQDNIIVAEYHNHRIQVFSSLA